MQHAEEICGLRVGSSLSRLQRKLKSRGAEVVRLADEAHRPLLKDAVKRATEGTFKIAVVGQIKAGKSSFINALIQRAGLIPTNVNPWTTAITRLIFNERAPDGAEGIFHFFDEEEWARLVSPGGRLQALAAKLVPGYNIEIVRSNLGVIRQRARERLGADFTTLLGQNHRVERITSDVLSQYVCVGSEEAGPNLAGRYADITRSAEIFLGRGPFDLRTYVIDTPGTNDPFLFRDEITHRALEEADTYIVVLTARQPLSGADLALLRILRSLQKSRIIVFVNRVDELGGNEDEGVDELRRFVKDRLDAELPGHQIPLILGSARWANVALGDADLLLECLLAPNTVPTMQQFDVSLPAEELASLDGEGIVAAARRAMFQASGIPKVYEALDAALASGPHAYFLHGLCRSMIDIARAQVPPVAAIGHAPDADSSAAAAIEALHKELEQASKATKAAIDELRSSCLRLVADSTERLKRALQAEVSASGRQAADTVLAAARGDNRKAPWRFDGDPLRRRLSKHVERASEEAFERISLLERQVLPRLSNLLKELDPERSMVSERQVSGPHGVGPSRHALGEVNALDLDAAVWMAWWRARIEPDERARQLETLVRGEFGEVASKLADAFERTLRGHVDATSAWSHAIHSEIVRGLGVRHEHILSVYRNSRSDVHPKHERRDIEQLVAELAHLDGDLGNLLGGALAQRSAQETRASAAAGARYGRD